jgi:hypothetical protein
MRGEKKMGTDRDDKRELLSREDSAAIQSVVEDGMRKFFKIVREMRAAFPVKIDVVGSNGCRMQGVLLDADGEFACGDPSGDMVFPFTFTATDDFGRIVLQMKMEQPHPVTADEGQEPS